MNIPLSQWIDYPHETNKRKKDMGLNHTVAQMNLTDIYKIPSHSSRTDSSQGPMEHVSRTDHMISHETYLIKFKKIETTPSAFCDYNGMKLEINNRNKAGKFTNIWILNSTLLCN